MRSRSAWISCVVFVAALVQGCGTLPDTGSFADASVQLRSALASSGTAVAGELDRAKQEQRARTLRELWARVNTAADAMVAYSESVGGIVSAGKAGGESVRQVADAGAKLADAAKIVLGPSIPGAVQLLAEAYSKIAEARAARALDEALQNMQPAVGRVSELVALQLDDLHGILVASSELVDIEIEKPYSKEISYLSQLRQQRRALYETGPLTAAIGQQLQQLDAAERTILAKLEPMQKDRSAAQERLKNARALIATARQGVMDWSAAHYQLLGAVRAGRTVEPRALLQTITELRDLLKRAREL